MEEEEDTNSTKKQRRKRKPRNLTPDPTSGADSEEELDEGEEKKRRRGRRKKKKEPPPPEPEEELTDLQHIFKVVEHLISNSGSAAFLDRPDDSMYGMSDYYEVIKKPMWLREVKRKYEAEEYKSATEVAADVRLMLENCYQYWGPHDTLTKRALKLEQLFENKVATFPEYLQKLCSLEATHGDMVKEEPDETLPKKPNNKKGGYVSKLLNWALYSQGDPEKLENTQEALTKARRAEREAAEKDLAIWESDNLLKPGVKEQIASMWEFPVIGQFLHLVYNVLTIDPISHLELERMLLMPQASKTLATLITSMLIPPLFRAKLEVGPAMPYSIWTRRLHTKVSSWYRNYHSKGDSTVEVFDSLGIEPQFWLVMGEDNPLDEYQFHELTFLQRVWLLKALCDFLLQNHKTIQDCINNREMEELREMNLGKDKEGYSYHYFPMFTEVRVYKMAKVPHKEWKNYDGGVEEAIIMYAEQEDDEDGQGQEQNLIAYTRRPLHKPPRCMRPSHSDFKLVCQSLEDVRSLVDEFCEADPLLLKGEGTNAKLVASLQSIISELESRESKMELAVYNVRAKMRDEWAQFNERREDYVDPGLAYWERKEKEEKRAVEEKPPDLSIPSTSSDGLLPDEDKRERRSRRESSLKMFAREENGADDDESAEESPLDFDDDSEDEWFASKRDKENRKKKRCMSAKKLKKLADMAQHSTAAKDRDLEKLNLNASGSGFGRSVSLKPGTFSEPPVKIKEEPLDHDEQTGQANVSSTKHASVISKSAKHHGQEHLKTKESHKMKKGTQVKQEITEESHFPTNTINNSTPGVIQTLVPPVKMSNVKLEKASKHAPITPDLSKLKRSNSPDPDIVYISDSEEPADIKPNPALLAQRVNSSSMPTINYSMNVPQQSMDNFMVQNAGPNQGQFVPLNLNSGDQVFGSQSQVYTVAQQPTQAITFQMPSAQPIVQQPVIRQNLNIVRMQSSQASTRPGLAPNQRFLLIQPNANNSNANHPSQPRAQSNNFPTTPTMQSVNWFGSRGSAQSNYSPRQRGQALAVVQGQSPRGRGSPRASLAPRSPITPTRGVQRFSARTPPNAVRTPNSVIRTPTQLGPRTPTPVRGRGPVAPVRPNPVRNLNFNRSPAKPVVSKPANDSSQRNDCPDIEGTLVVSQTDNGGFGYVVMLPDGGKISLTHDQLAKIRSDNGGTLPKTCKVPLNMQTEGFKID